MAIEPRKPERPIESRSGSGVSPPPLPNIPPARDVPQIPEELLKPVVSPVLPGAPKPSATDSRAMQQSTAVMGMGFDFLGTIVVFALLGWGLDSFTGITPIGVVSGLVLGVVVGFYRLVRGALRRMR